MPLPIRKPSGVGERVVPALPPLDAAGNRPTLAFADAAIVRPIVKRREAAGSTRRQLAERGGIRAEVLNRAERGAVVPGVRTLAKIETALQRHNRR